MSLPASKNKVYGVRASIADLVRSLAALASAAVSRNWFSIDSTMMKAAKTERRRLFNAS